MTDAKSALAHFLELADRGPALRAALAGELADLLAAWPADYPPNMRAVCEKLLEKARCEIREQAPPAAEIPPVCDLGLVAAIREGADFTRLFAGRIGISPSRAEGIFADGSAEALATVCKGAGLGRAAFSAIAILADEKCSTGERLARLAAYDAVPSGSAERTLNAWRAMDRFAHAA